MTETSTQSISAHEYEGEQEEMLMQMRRDYHALHCTALLLDDGPTSLDPY